MTITLTLTKDELNLVLAALAELPAKHSFALLLKLQAEAQKAQEPEVA